ncbi:MAG: hypothetical protein NC924_04355 [Candidatus Omnitrophica bacterium]|nr:hypothetical protein [Candidatus Omnitrophota bacterium]
MAECALLKGCLFFNDKMPIDSALGKLYKNRYCLKDNSQCARYMIASTIGREKVPTNLFPNMHEEAEKILKENKA